MASLRSQDARHYVEGPVPIRGAKVPYQPDAKRDSHGEKEEEEEGMVHGKVGPTKHARDRSDRH
jgi:hypothetical protein